MIAGTDPSGAKSPARDGRTASIRASGAPGSDPSLLDATEVAARLGVDAEVGLSDEEAAARLRSDGPNVLDAQPPVPLWRRVLRQFEDPLVYLLLVAMAISTIAWWFEGAQGLPLDVVVIALIVVLNALIGFIQEGRAEEAVAALARMTAATSTVLRSGRLIAIPSAEIVRGDVLVLAEGDAVGADGRLISAAALRIEEAPLTGESEPAEKAPATLVGEVGVGDRTNAVFKGTAVVHGVGRALVTETGMTTRMGAIARMLDERAEEASPLDREVARLTRSLGAIVLAIALVVMVVLLLIQRPTSLAGAVDVLLVDVLLVGVSLAVAAVPEGLPAILSLVLALGVQELAKRNAVMKSLHSVETLGSASLVCSDKTGTLTRNEMTIRVVATASGTLELTGTGYAPEGGPEGDPDPVLLREASAVVGAGAIANNAALSRTDEGEWTITGDPTEGAFLVAQHKLDGVADLVEGAVREAEVPFDSERKLMSVLAVHPDLEGRRLVTKGAPDVLLPRCVAERVGDEVVPLDDERQRRVESEVERLNAAGYRTIGVAYSLTDGAPEDIDEEDEDGLVLLGVVGIIDLPRDEARTAVAEAKRAGVRVVMITGDHPTTAARIAADLGIADEDERALSGLELDALDEPGLREAARRASVYARVAPEHKLRIVDALRADGSVVAMTGDGVNDAPALKAADIGVAMGITGTEVTKEASTMILGDDDFATIVAAIRRGRAIFDNIRKFMRYLLSSNMGEIVTVFAGIVLADALGIRGAATTGLAVPILAVQILWINLVTDSAPALAMGVDPETEDVMARPPRGRGDRIVDRAMWARILVIGAVMGLVSLAVLDLLLPEGLLPSSLAPGGTTDLRTARTAAFTTLVLAQLFNALNSRSDLRSAFVGIFDNRWLWGAIGIGVIAQIAVVHLQILQAAFATSSLSAAQWAVCAGAASLVLWIEEAVKAVRRAVRRSAR